MITIDLATLHTLAILAREATRAREARGDLATSPALGDCRQAVDAASRLIEGAFARTVRTAA